MHVVIERYDGQHGGFEYTVSGPFFDRETADLLVKHTEAEWARVATLPEVA